jgi:hypothetical protein
MKNVVAMAAAAIDEHRAFLARDMAHLDGGKGTILK